MSKIRVCVVGASGLTARELLKILVRHPGLEPAGVTGRTAAGQMIEEIFPVLEGRVSLRIDETDAEKIARGYDAFFLALPHTVAMEVAPVLIKSGKPLVDLSADYRLKDPAVYEKWYKTEHKDPGNLEKAVYGLTELGRDEVSKASFVANPGCYPTAAELAVAPVLELVNTESIIIDAKSGVSGAGVKLKKETSYINANENFSAYKAGRHQHTPEMEQFLSGVCSETVRILFTPHLTPMERGIFETIYLDLEKETSREEILRKFRDFYPEDKNPFVRISEKPVGVQDVNYTNRCRIYPEVVGKKLILCSVIDNLVKGAAGQAVQNMNLMTGQPEESGLI